MTINDIVIIKVEINYWTAKKVLSTQSGFKVGMQFV
jgi:hypothetical protein